jgi:hypothetical protein
VTATEGRCVAEDPPLALARYRAGLRAFLSSDRSLDAWRGAAEPSVEAMLEAHSALMAELATTGWSRHGWPAEAGGLGGDLRHRAVLYDELAAHDLPVPAQYALLETMAPAMLNFAPSLARKFLPAFLNGGEWWGQGFSEPDAGSDMASIRTQAVRDGNRYVLNGQKLWTTYGATATRLMCLVRTGEPSSRHRGLSMLFLDADSPGVELRPIALASGRNEVAEMFFQDVTVPCSRLVGAENDGWAVAMYLLQFERASYAWLTSAVLLAQLRRLRRELAGYGELAARTFARAYLDVVALRCSSIATVRRLADGETVGPEASVDKILLARAEQSVFDAARQLLEPVLEIGGAGVDAWRADWWYSRAATILGGSVEIQRSIVADRLLRLPRE